MKKRLIFGLCLLLLVAMMPWGGATAAARTLTLSELQQTYPHGAYWNHTKGGNEDYTWSPCNHHAGNCAYNGSCGCNTYQNVAIQCMGFAYQLASLAYDSNPRSDWPTHRDVSALDTLKAGDIVRYRNNTHSIFVTAVVGDTVFLADCNWDGHCGIQWNRTVTKDTLRASFTYVKSAPHALEGAATLTVRYHGGGGSIPNEVTGYTYRVLSTNGINLRADAGTSHTKLTALPYNTAFTVAVGDTKEADGYTWGKTTYDGKTGWVVISDFVEQTETLWDGDWALVDDLVYHHSTPLTHIALYGQPLVVPPTAEEMGLTREGYRFAGWNTAADGSGVAWCEGMTPDALCPDTAATVTLYAQWIPILPGDADGDGRVNNRDLGLLQQYLNDWEVVVTAEADMNADGKLNNRDLGLLQRYLNDWKTEEGE